MALRASAWTRADWRRAGLCLEFEDDGPGIAAADRERALQRGVRIDETVDGQGIGLAAARDIAVAYGGSLEIGDGSWGGALIRVRLPGR